jgi:hypothetical protein
MAATIDRALGIPATGVWHDSLSRPHNIYYGDPIPGFLTASQSRKAVCAP